MNRLRQVIIYVAALITGMLALGGCTKAKLLMPRSALLIHEALSVKPVYPDHGAQWNDYVQASGADVFSATDLACLGTEPRYSNCVHGGELRKVELPGVADCAGVSATDELGAFQWECRVSGGTAALYGQLTGKLADLIEDSGSAWKANSVRVTGAVVASSDSEVWWSNPVEPLPQNGGGSDSVVTLTNAGSYGTIYTLEADRATQGYQISDDHLAIVALNDHVLTYAGSASFNCDTANGLDDGANDRICVLAAGTHDFLWIEGSLDGHPSSGTEADSNLLLVQSAFTRLNSLRAKNSGGAGGDGWESILLNGLQSSRVQDLKMGNSSLQMDSSVGNLLINSFADYGGFRIGSSSYNVFDRLTASGTFAGLDVQNGSEHNTFSRVLSFSNQNVGIQLAGTANPSNVFAFVTVANNGDSGMGFYSGTKNVIHDVVAVSNTLHGVNLVADETSLSQVVSAQNQIFGIEVGSSFNRFSSNLLIGNNPSGDCDIGAVTEPGLDASCAASDLSSGVLNSVVDGALDLGIDFQGKIGMEDTENGSDSLGAAAAFPAALDSFDFLDFLTPERGWGKDGAGVLGDTSLAGKWTAGNGRIWDFAISSGGTRIYNRSGDASAQNASFVDGANCPSEVDGSVVVRDVSGGEISGDGVGNDDGVCNVGENCLGNIYLPNAIEVLGDGIGNENALCETGETCIYAPHFGAYQGHGALSRSCIFQDGVVSGVTMLAYQNLAY